MPADGAPGEGPRASQRPVPRHLPGPALQLTGRDTEADVLDQMLADPGRALVTVVISGMSGVGKTALATWWLRQHQHQFSDGQVHARLAGPHGLGETPHEVLGRWLRALGVPADRIPVGQAGRVRLWRSRTTGCRLAVLIDDAPSAAVVAALLPGAGFVLVTSRRMLAAGPASGFRQLRLRPLSRQAAVALVAGELAGIPPGSGTGAAGGLARLCGGLPLALRCAAGCLHGTPLADLAVPAAIEQARLVAQGVPRPEARARAVIEAASGRLGPELARAWRLMSLCPGPQVSSELAAAVLGHSPARTRQLLDGLAGSALIEQAGGGWWQFHELAQAQAREQAARTETPAARGAATGRMLTWYTQTAIGAHASMITSNAFPADAMPPADGPPAAGAVMAAWADRHQPAMIAALRSAAARGDHAGAVRLAGVLWPLLGWHGCYHEQLAAARLGVRAARACGDAVAEARLLTGTGFALRRLGRPGAAVAAFRSAARIWLDRQDHPQLAAVLRELGRVAAERGRQAEAARYLLQAQAFGAADPRRER